MLSYRLNRFATGFDDLPRGILWTYDESPMIRFLGNRTGLPRWLFGYGVIETDRALTTDEMRRFDIVEA
jgi:hypothetical protein